MGSEPLPVDRHELEVAVMVFSGPFFGQGGFSSPFMTAVQLKNYDIVHMLLEESVVAIDVNARDKQTKCVV